MAWISDLDLKSEAETWELRTHPSLLCIDEETAQRGIGPDSVEPWEKELSLELGPRTLYPSPGCQEDTF